jgi:uncharacterized OsmC-like protein
MPKPNFKVTQVREVTISASSHADATKRASKLFDKKDCSIRETVKRVSPTTLKKEK